MAGDSGFQRARRPEQVRARREAIVRTARDMLADRPLADISLNELSARVGLAKSNVLRYFDSREAVFLEVLDRSWGAWLDELETAAAPAAGRDGRFAAETRTAGRVAASLVARPELCELISGMAGVLERNISVDFARHFKQRAAAHTERLARLVRREVPVLDDAGAAHFAGAVFVVVAGLWPYARPTEAIARVSAEMGAPPAWDAFVAGLAEGLVNQLVGLTARAAPPPGGQGSRGAFSP
ncbi:TetR/AcrR family transcriptional regulator [Streptomyces avicenniae]|uniref:TetR/AcrR family transcriptional regulator n=1 Tax=Streptomyces avicenniae TaxID=500153 RepID=UPI00069C9EA8|nr:TetR family transcriptional regulator [Streptomyces avicenniae]